MVAVVHRASVRAGALVRQQPASRRRSMNANAILSDLLRAVRLRRCTNIALVWLPLLAVATVLGWRISGTLAAVAVFASGATAIFAFGRLQARAVDNRWLARALNGRRTDLDDSADLFFAESATLTGLERLQAARLRQRLEATPPPDLRPAWSTRAIAASIFLALAGLAAIPRWPTQVPTSFADVLSSVGIASEAPSHTRLVQAMLQVTPPGYTRGTAREQSTLEAKAPQGSSLRWQLRFDPQPRAAALVFHDGRRVPLERQGEDWIARHVLDKSTLYRIVPEGGPPLRSQRLHRLEAVPDRAPQLRIVTPDHSLSLVRAGQHGWALGFEASDDHGIATTAQLRVSLAQGSGENITFRERILSLQGRGTATRKRYAHRFDLPALGLAPGDDLIIQLVVHDNRTPGPQQVRSPSLILRWPPTLGEENAGLDGMANKVLPAYFRSQRQIIIDAEALQARKRRLDGEVFVERSDEIGADQRILRLRYGQFLGEESDGAPQLPTNDAEPEDTDEHDSTSTPATQDAHADEHAMDSTEASPTFGREPDITELYGHVHDQPEAATLLDPQTRTTLKAALDQMWQSELHLRQGHPELALPFAYRALRHIKEVQQASRIYLARVGTPELPPIDESRRLGGDRTGLARRNAALATATAADPMLSRLWQSLDEMPTPGRVASTIDFESLERWLRANEARLADPLPLAAAVDALRRDPACAPCRRNLRALLWPLLERPASTVSRRDDADASGRRYLDALLRERTP